MLKAGSLIYALAIALLVSAISTALILLSSHFKLEQNQYAAQLKVLANAESGMTLLQHGPTAHSNREKLIFLKLEKTVLKSVRRPWGFFDVATSTAHQGRANYSIKALLGQNPDRANETALVMADHGKPLRLCGNVRIEGKCYLPKSGVERAYIEGQNYTGDQLIYGARAQSERNLAPLNQHRISVLTDQLAGRFDNEDSLRLISHWSFDTLEHHFHNRTLVLFADNDLKLNSGSITGNVIIYSEKSITVTDEMQLDQVMLVSKDIIFEDDCRAMCAGNCFRDDCSWRARQSHVPQCFDGARNKPRRRLRSHTLQSEFIDLWSCGASTCWFSQQVLLRRLFLSLRLP